MIYKSKEDFMMDMLPDYEEPKTPKGFEKVGYKIPKIGDWMVDFYGKPYKITKKNVQYYFEQHIVFRKIK